LAGAKRKPAIQHLLESAAFAWWRARDSCEKFKKAAKVPIHNDLMPFKNQLASHHSNE
jgi:hypothetical protein